MDAEKVKKFPLISLGV